MRRDRIFVVCDSVVSHDGERMRLASKMLAIQHLHALTASIGSVFVTAMWTQHALTLMRAVDFTSLVDEAPQILRSIAHDLPVTARAQANATILLFGFKHGTACGYEFRSADGFAARELPHGAWLRPGLPAREPQEEGDAPRAARSDGIEESPPAPRLPAFATLSEWSAATQSIGHALRQQRELEPHAIGGMGYATLLTEFAITQTPLFDLDVSVDGESI